MWCTHCGLRMHEPTSACPSPHAYDPNDAAPPIGTRNHSSCRSCDVNE